jgi:glutathione peroxidase
MSFLRRYKIQIKVFIILIVTIVMLKSIFQNTIEELPFFGEKVDFSSKNFYDFEAKMLNGQTVSMNQFKGKTVVVVNTASKCGLTPQYEGLEQLYEKYKDEGLVILGFPCNQFAGQEPGTSDEIESFCKVNYGVSFPMFEKTDVNGKDAHLIFQYLKSVLGDFPIDSIKWNFTKFLIDKNGKPYKRFAPNTEPVEMEEDIIHLLNS